MLRSSRDFCNLTDWVSRRRLVALRSLSKVLIADDWESRRRVVALRSLSKVLSLDSKLLMRKLEALSCFWVSACLVSLEVIFDVSVVMILVHLSSLVWRAVEMRSCIWSREVGAMVDVKL